MQADTIGSVSMRMLSMRNPTTCRPSVTLHGLAAALLALAAATAPAAAQPGPASSSAAAPTPFVIGTHQPTTTFQGRWLRRIYAEAFKRLDMPVEVAIYPLQRLTVLLDLGHIDGDTARVHGYAAAHPQAVRVEESIYPMTFGLYALDPAPAIARTADLAGSPLRAGYLRGVAICESSLRAQLPAEQVVPLTTEEQGLGMMQSRRLDVYCGSEYGMLDLSLSPQFRSAKPRLMVKFGESMPLHPYLHRRWEGLAPRLAQALRQMKDEGLIERYRAESLKEAAAGAP